MTASVLVAAIAACPLVFPGAIAAGNIASKGLPGGYAPAKLTEDVKAAAEFAVQEEAKRESIPLNLARIPKAEKQIVAGINYRLLLVVERSGSTREANVVVFRGLDSRYSLTSWEWLGR
jgi:hypothetical protein